MSDSSVRQQLEVIRERLTNVNLHRDGYEIVMLCCLIDLCDALLATEQSTDPDKETTDRILNRYGLDRIEADSGDRMGDAQSGGKPSNASEVHRATAPPSLRVERWTVLDCNGHQFNVDANNQLTTKATAQRIADKYNALGGWKHYQPLRIVRLVELREDERVISDEELKLRETLIFGELAEKSAECERLRQHWRDAVAFEATQRAELEAMQAERDELKRDKKAWRDLALEPQSAAVLQSGWVEGVVVQGAVKWPPSPMQPPGLGHAMSEHVVEVDLPIGTPVLVRVKPS